MSTFQEVSRFFINILHKDYTQNTRLPCVSLVKTQKRFKNLFFHLKIQKNVIFYLYYQTLKYSGKSPGLYCASRNCQNWFHHQIHYVHQFLERKLIPPISWPTSKSTTAPSVEDNFMLTSKIQRQISPSRSAVATSGCRSSIH